jgi:hypothetical protein
MNNQDGKSRLFITVKEASIKRMCNRNVMTYTHTHHTYTTMHTHTHTHTPNIHTFSFPIHKCPQDPTHPTENPMYQWRSFQALTAIKDTLFRVNTTKFLSERSTEEG